VIAPNTATITQLNKVYCVETNLFTVTSIALNEETKVITIKVIGAPEIEEDEE
jgi:hypothetical protein